MIDNDLWSYLRMPGPDEEWPCYPEDVREKWEKKDSKIKTFIANNGSLQGLDVGSWEKLLRTRFEGEPEMFETVWKGKSLSYS
jgi:hypothetical protein